jgi:hypothetical protein
LLIAGTTLIGLFIGLFTVGTFGLFDAPWTDYIEMAAIGAPLWLISLLTFFAVGIPFFFLFILGLKILVKKLRSIGTPAKLVLLGLWLLSIIGLAVLGIQQATQRAFDGEVVITETLPVTAQDTLYLAMQNDPQFSSGVYRSRGGVDIKVDEDNNKVIYNTDVRLVVKSTRDSIARMEVIKMADGSDSRDARDRASEIRYNTNFRDGKLFLDSHLTSALKNNYRNQEVRVVLYLPEGSTLYTEKNVAYYHRSSDYYGNILDYNSEEKFLKIGNNSATCEDCPVEETEAWENDDSWESDSSWDEDEFEGTIDIEGDTTTGNDRVRVKINKDGVNITDDVKGIKVSKDGVEIQN